jgi:hypothetical protein
MTNVITKKSSGVLLVSSLSLVLAACGPVDEDPGQGVEVVKSAQTVNEGNFATGFGAQVGIGAGNISLIAAWQATDTSSNQPQIVEQGLNFNTSLALSVGGSSSLLRGVSTSGRPVSSPAVAYGSTDVDMFLIVWQDDWSGTDSDIWGAFLTTDGKIVPGSPFTINFDGDLERTPTVVFVPMKQQFLVTYRRTHGSTTAISANWVSASAQITPLQDIVTSGVNNSLTATKQTASLINASQAVLLTYNENKYVFVATSTLALNGATTTVANATGIQSASNPSVGSFGLAWKTGSGTSTKIQSMTYPINCLAPFCADAVVNLFTLSAGGSANGLNNPVISPLGMGYAVYAGYLPASLQFLGVASVDQNGHLFQSNSSIVSTCSGGLKSGLSLGQPGTVSAAAPTDTSARSYLLYDAECQTAGFQKEWVVAPSPTDLDDFLLNNVSN